MNVWVHPDRATIAVDTTGISVIHGKVSVSKLVPLVQINAVIAGRGSGGLIGVLYSGVCRMPFSFDDLAAHMPEFLNKSLIEYERVCRLAGYEPEDVSTVDQIAFVGWSESEDRMAAWLYVRGERERTFSARRISPWTIAPGECFSERPAVPTNHEEVVHIAVKQTAWHLAAHPGKAIGGDLLVADLTRTSLTITTACDLDAAVAAL